MAKHAQNTCYTLQTDLARLVKLLFLQLAAEIFRCETCCEEEVLYAQSRPKDVSQRNQVAEKQLPRVTAPYVRSA